MNMESRPFSNSYYNDLKASKAADLKSSAATLSCHYTSAICDQVPSPRLLFWSDRLSFFLGFQKTSHEQWSVDELETKLDIFAGNKLVAGMRPIAMRYGGYQFGHWAGQLGDGRAITLGEVEVQKNQANINRYEIQLKGAGRTVYSRQGDGKAVLRSSLREYLCSEYMFYLGVPSTRALSCMLTGENVDRDMFYDGNVRSEPGAVVTRIAPSFIRFGHFEILAANKEIDELKLLLNFTLNSYYSHLLDKEFFKDQNFNTAQDWLQQFCSYETGDLKINQSILAQTAKAVKQSFVQHFAENEVLNTLNYKKGLPVDIFKLETNQRDLILAALFAEVSARTAYLLAHWTRVGFTHGVMNTDNMSILGLTIDYGPFGFLDDYDPNWTPNTTDFREKRYRFSHQPSVAQWNLIRLAEAFSMAMENSDLLNIGLRCYSDVFSMCFKDMSAQKLGLRTEQIAKDELRFLNVLQDFLTTEQVDFTIFYNKLIEYRQLQSKSRLTTACEKEKFFECCFYKNYLHQVGREERQENLDKFLNEYDKLLLELSEVENREKISIMQEVNPKFQLRNYILQASIDRLEKVLSGVESPEGRQIKEPYTDFLLEAVQSPYHLSDEVRLLFSHKRPEWARNRAGCSALSCSS